MSGVNCEKKQNPVKIKENFRVLFFLPKNRKENGLIYFFIASIITNRKLCNLFIKRVICVRVEGIKGLDFSSMKSEVESKTLSQKSDEAAMVNAFEKNELVMKEDERKADDFKSLTEDLKKVSIEIKNTRFEFDIHEATKRVIVKVIDKTTDKVISEIPPEKFLDLIADIWKQVGLIVDKKV